MNKWELFLFLAMLFGVEGLDKLDAQMPASSDKKRISAAIGTRPPLWKYIHDSYLQDKKPLWKYFPRLDIQTEFEKVKHFEQDSLVSTQDSLVSTLLNITYPNAMLRIDVKGDRKYFKDLKNMAINAEMDADLVIRLNGNYANFFAGRKTILGTRKGLEFLLGYSNIFFTQTDKDSSGSEEIVDSDPTIGEVITDVDVRSNKFIDERGAIIALGGEISGLGASRLGVIYELLRSEDDIVTTILQSNDVIGTSFQKIVSENDKQSIVSGVFLNTEFFSLRYTKIKNTDKLINLSNIEVLGISASNNDTTNVENKFQEYLLEINKHIGYSGTNIPLELYVLASEGKDKKVRPSILFNFGFEKEKYYAIAFAGKDNFIDQFGEEQKRYSGRLILNAFTKGKILAYEGEHNRAVQEWLKGIEDRHRNVSRYRRDLDIYDSEYDRLLTNLIHGMFLDIRFEDLKNGHRKRYIARANLQDIFSRFFNNIPVILLADYAYNERDLDEGKAKRVGVEFGLALGVGPIRGYVSMEWKSFSEPVSYNPSIIRREDDKITIVGVNINF